MQESKRDPREDPRPGDLVLVGSCLCFVVNVYGGIVEYVWSGQLQGKVYSMSAAAWVNGSKDGVVIYAA